MPGFTDRYIAALKAKPGAIQTDFHEANRKYRGLVIRVSKTGTKTWVFVYQFNRSRVRMSFGTFPAVSVAEAHERTIEYRRYLQEVPPRDPRTVVKHSDAMTMADLAESYLVHHARPKLRNAPKIEGILRRNVLPLIGSISLRELHTRDLNRVVDAVLARGKKIAAARTFQTTRAMLNWAVSRGDLDRSPMDRMTKPDDSTFRDRTLSPKEIRIFWHNLPKAIPLKAVQRILKLELVTGQRVGEICGMTRDELDLDRRNTWTIPAARSKNKHAHEIPLTPLATELIRAALADAGDSKFIFPDPKTGVAYTSTAITTRVSGAYRDIGIDHFSSHDLRRTCADSMAELGVLDGIVGRVLNHRSIFKATVTQKHYITRSYEREMRAALELWESRLRAIIGGEPIADVIPLRSNAS
jgi:integrase